jgi:hypothetical protein
MVEADDAATTVTGASAHKYKCHEALEVCGIYGEEQKGKGNSDGI